MKLSSKIGKVEASDQKIFEFLSDFNNFEHLVPSDKIRDWEADTSSCKFKIDPVGQVGFKIVESEPYKLIKLTNLEETKYNFNFWIQLKQLEPNQTAIKLVFDVQLNPMMQAMAKKPVQTFLDTLVDKLKHFDYETKRV